MGFFSKQLANVVEWNETREGVLFWKWQNEEIKKDSRLIIRPGQDAIFLYNGKIEGIFEEEGNFEIESQIIPFLTTLKSFKFGFNAPLRAEVLFINTKEMLVKWGTKNAINLPAPGLPGGMPIRAFGTFSCKIGDYKVLIEKLAGIRQMYTVDEVKERIITDLNPLLMSWIGKEGRDMFNLQMDAGKIGEGIAQELNREMGELGIAITNFTIESFSYPEEVKKMQEKAAAQAMVGDVNKYQQMAMADSLGKGGSGGAASDMVGLQMGMALGQQMVNQMNMNQSAASGAAAGGNGSAPKFCPNCGTPTNGANFCSNCGNKLV
ncbi:MAG: SPFH domain-containing protein [Lachnospiraceae bacterium]